MKRYIHNTKANYIIGMCYDITNRMREAYEISILEGGTDYDQKKAKDMIRNSTLFSSHDQYIKYYSIKVNQINKRLMDMKEADIILAFQDEDKCKSIFRDTIKDDSEYEQWLSNTK